MVKRALSLSTRLSLILACLGICAGIATPAKAQQINSVLLNNSPTIAYWKAWDSIYGTNLPNGSGTYVYMTYLASFIGGGFGSDYSVIDVASPFQTYWYTSASQLNFYPYAQNNYGGTARPGCAYVYPTNICDSVQICKSGLCTNAFTFTLNGLP